MDNSVVSIQLSEPDCSFVVWKNGRIIDKKFCLSDDNRTAFEQASMYESWTEPVVQHFEMVTAEEEPAFSNLPKHSGSLMVFDTWGTSSYYHLLIDHIIPLWATKKYLELKQSEDEFRELFSYYRISTNDYPHELSTINVIFSHFMGSEFLENVSGEYDNIVYGYLYPFRPHRGPKYENRIFENYRQYLRMFRDEFRYKSPSEDRVILVPERADRKQKFVEYFTNKYKDEFNFKSVDFGKLTIEEQIKICGQASGIFGAEGAAFANQVFLPENAFCIPVCKEPHRFLFHENLANYCGHKFLAVNPRFYNKAKCEQQILQVLNAFQLPAAP